MNNATQEKELRNIVFLKQERAEKLFAEKLDNELFPPEKLSSRWIGNAVTALMKSQPVSHRLSLQDFAKVVKICIDGGDAFTLFEFGVLSNSLEIVSPYDLGLSPLSYTELIEEAARHIAYYQKRINEIKDEVNLQVEEEFKMKAAAEKGVTGFGKLKAEA